MDTRYRITAPVAGINQKIGTLQFRDSVAETSDVSDLPYFRRQGYRVEELDAQGAVDEQLPKPPVDGDDPAGPADPPKKPAKSAAKADWVTYAVAQGVLPAEAETMTRDQLAELFATEQTGDQK